MVVLLLQAAADLHGVDASDQFPSQHAFAEASRQSTARITGERAPCAVQLMTSLCVWLWID